LPQPITSHQEKTNDLTSNTHTGIAAVIPAYKITSLLMRPDLEERRRRMWEQMRKEQARRSAPVPDVAEDPGTLRGPLVN
jgi:hypothetical protein